MIDVFEIYWRKIWGCANCYASFKSQFSSMDSLNLQVRIETWRTVIETVNPVNIHICNIVQLTIAIYHYRTLDRAAIFSYNRTQIDIENGIWQKKPNHILDSKYNLCIETSKIRCRRTDVTTGVVYVCTDFFSDTTNFIVWFIVYFKIYFCTK